MILRSYLILLFVIIALTGCRRSQEEAFFPTVPENWKGDHYRENNIYPEAEQWWAIFNDPFLNRLEEEAIANNQSLELAVQRLNEARAFVQDAYADYLPNVDFAPSYFNQDSLVKNAPGDGEFSSSSFRFHNLDYTLPLSLSYEVDLWGKISGSYAASNYDYQASYEATRGVWLSITTDVAQNYFLLRSLDNQLEAVEKALDVRKNALEVNQSRYNSGFISFTDVTRARLEYSQAMADRENLLRLRILQEDALAWLCGTYASEFRVEQSPSALFVPKIATGLPSELLCRRPDILEAENSMASLHAQMGVAYSSFFPSLRLNGAVGLYAPFLKDLFSWKARLWSFGFDVVQTVFDGGARQANYEAAKARYFQGLAAYQNQVLIAFKDVEDALANIHHRELEAGYLMEGVIAAQDTYALSYERYMKGLVTYLDVVDVERSVLQLQQSLAEVHGQQLIAVVVLIKAIGGGW